MKPPQKPLRGYWFKDGLVGLVGSLQRGNLIGGVNLVVGLPVHIAIGLDAVGAVHLGVGVDAGQFPSHFVAAGDGQRVLDEVGLSLGESGRGSACLGCHENEGSAKPPYAKVGDVMLEECTEDKLLDEIYKQLGMERK